MGLQFCVALHQRLALSITGLPEESWSISECRKKREWEEEQQPFRERLKEEKKPLKSKLFPSLQGLKPLNITGVPNRNPCVPLLWGDITSGSNRHHLNISWLVGIISLRTVRAENGIIQSFVSQELLLLIKKHKLLHLSVNICPPDAAARHPPPLRLLLQSRHHSSSHTLT